MLYLSTYDHITDFNIYMFHYNSIYNVFYKHNTCSGLPMVTIQSWRMPVATWTDHWRCGQSPWRYQEWALIADTPNSSMHGHISFAPAKHLATPPLVEKNITYLTIISCQTMIVRFNEIVSLSLQWVGKCLIPHLYLRTYLGNWSNKIFPVIRKNLWCTWLIQPLYFWSVYDGHTPNKDPWLTSY